VDYIRAKKNKMKNFVDKDSSDEEILEQE